MRAVILAGGLGTRLKPYTITLPKPLVPIGGEMPILEIVIKQLKGHGFNRLTIAVNHMANLIQAFFQDGARWGIEIDYSIENKPLSTIGPLTLIDDLPENFVVMNGDVLSDVHYGKLFDKHCREGNDVTVSVFQREQLIDFGVLQYSDDGRVTDFIEKPVERFNVSMGVYCMNRTVVESLPKNELYGFDHLMRDGLKNGMRLQAVPFDGYWLDIGRPDDYATANDDFDSIRNRLGI
jgi:NDP-sugar pyrophosphorylase family protein